MNPSPRKDYVGNVAVAKLTLTDANAGVKATGTITLDSAEAGDIVTVNGLEYLAVAGAKADDTEFSIDTSDTAAALDLADSIDDDVRLAGTGLDVTATSALGVVTIVCTEFGARGNTVTLETSTEVRAAVSAETLEGGSDADVVIVNGLIYTPVVGAKGDDTEFSIDTSDAAAATDLADSIDDDVRAGTENVSIAATATANVVYIVATGVGAHKATIAGSANIVASGFNVTSMTSSIPDNNETFKRVNFINTPYSVQATGADKKDGRIKVVDSETVFNTITTRTRVLWGNREGYIKTFTASTSLVFTWLDKEKEEVDTTKTMAEVIASGSMIILNEVY